jgi:hypothetical protein
MEKLYMPRYWLNFTYLFVFLHLFGGFCHTSESAISFVLKKKLMKNKGSRFREKHLATRLELANVLKGIFENQPSMSSPHSYSKPDDIQKYSSEESAIKFVISNNLMMLENRNFSGFKAATGKELSHLAKVVNSKFKNIKGFKPLSFHIKSSEKITREQLAVTAKAIFSIKPTPETKAAIKTKPSVHPVITKASHPVTSKIASKPSTAHSKKKDIQLPQTKVETIKTHPTPKQPIINKTKISEVKVSQPQIKHPLPEAIDASTPSETPKNTPKPILKSINGKLKISKANPIVQKIRPQVEVLETPKSTKLLNARMNGLIHQFVKFPSKHSLYHSMMKQAWSKGILKNLKNKNFRHDRILSTNDFVSLIDWLHTNYKGGEIQGNNIQEKIQSFKSKAVIPKQMQLDKPTKVKDAIFTWAQLISDTKIKAMTYHIAIKVVADHGLIRENSSLFNTEHLRLFDAISLTQTMGELLSIKRHSQISWFKQIKSEPAPPENLDQSLGMSEPKPKQKIIPKKETPITTKTMLAEPFSTDIVDDLFGSQNTSITPMPEQIAVSHDMEVSSFLDEISGIPVQTESFTHQPDNPTPRFVSPSFPPKQAMSLHSLLPNRPS